MKPLIIYRANCVDGFGAAFSAWMKLGDGADYVPANPGEFTVGQLAKSSGFCRLVSKDGVMHYVDGRDVYILGIGFSRDVMEHIIDAANHVVWIDHHEDSIDVAEYWCSPKEPLEIHTAKYEVICNQSRSSALLAFEEFFHNQCRHPKLVGYIDDYALGKFKLEGTKKTIELILGDTPWDFEKWSRWTLQLDRIGFGTMRGWIK